MARTRYTAPVDPSDRFASQIKALQQQVAELQRAGQARRRIGVTATRSTNQSMTGAALTAISWTAETEDTDGFITPTSTTITIPAGLGGVYGISASASMAAGIANSYMRIAAGGKNYQPPSSNVGDIGFGFVRPLAAGETVVVSILNGGATTNMSSAQVDVYRIGP